MARHARSIPDEIVYQIRQSANIVQLAAHLGYPVTKRGSSHFIVCPFHADSSEDGGSCLLNVPSYTERSGRGEPNWFKCFGSCGLTGSVFRFYCLHHGWPPDGFWFQRAVREVAEIFGMGHIVPEVSTGDDRRIRIRRLFNNRRLSFCGQTIIQAPETNDPAVCDTWTLKARRSDRTPEGLFQRPGYEDPDADLFDEPDENEPLVYWPLLPRSVEPHYPLRLVLVETLSVVAVVERHGLRVRGIMLYADDLAPAAEWRMSRNRATFMTPAPDDPDALPLFSARLAVESPLDWLRLSRAGLPVLWGIWRPGTVPNGPARSVAPTTIPHITALFPGKGTPGPDRMEQCVSADLPWIPRMRVLPEYPSVAVLGPRKLEAALEGWETEVNGPRWNSVATEAAPT